MQRMGWKGPTGSRKTTEEAPVTSGEGDGGVDKSGSHGYRGADRFRIYLTSQFLFF